MKNSDNSYVISYYYRYRGGSAILKYSADAATAEYVVQNVAT